MWKRILIGVAALSVALIVVVALTAPGEPPAAETEFDDWFGVREQIAAYTECGGPGEIPSLHEQRLSLTRSLDPTFISEYGLSEDFIQQRRATLKYADDRWTELACAPTQEPSQVSATCDALLKMFIAYGDALPGLWEKAHGPNGSAYLPVAEEATEKAAEMHRQLKAGGCL
jgi:hypothetical protein